MSRPARRRRPAPIPWSEWLARTVGELAVHPAALTALVTQVAALVIALRDGHLAQDQVIALVTALVAAVAQGFLPNAVGPAGSPVMTEARDVITFPKDRTARSPRKRGPRKPKPLPNGPPSPSLPPSVPPSGPEAA